MSSTSKKKPRRAARRCPRPTIVQELLLPKGDFTWNEALDWIVGHRFLAGHSEETPCVYRARQWSPRRFKKGSLHKIRFGRSSIQAVVGCPSEKTSEAYERRRARLKKPSVQKKRTANSRQQTARNSPRMLDAQSPKPKALSSGRKTQDARRKARKP